MIFWALVLFLVVPVLLAMAFAARAKPPAPARCRVCEDGKELAQAPIAGRKGLRVALRCPACESLFVTKLSAMSAQPVDEAGFAREFGPADRPR